MIRSRTAGPDDEADVISRVDIWKCVFALPEPFRLGRHVIAQRDYTVLRIETAGGVEGLAFALARGAPVDVVLAEMVAPRALGRDVSRTAALAASCAGELVHHAPEGLLQRALSLLDIAAWDVKGRVAGLPVWSLLGGDRPSAPVMLVEGYPMAGEGDEGFAERLARRAAEGYPALKIANSGDPAELMRRLRLTRALAGDDVALTVDIDHGWTDLREGVAQARSWSDLGLAWVEDPIHGHETDRLHRLHEAIDVPLGVGDEVTNARTLHTLLDRRSVDVLRLDLTCCGGFTGFAPLYHHARRRGVAISTHVYPELHRHVVFAHPGCGPLEMFEDGSRWDTSSRFVRTPGLRLAEETGTLVIDAPSAPGLGLEVDWPAVRAHAVRHHALTAADAVVRAPVAP